MQMQQRLGQNVLLIALLCVAGGLHPLQALEPLPAEELDEVTVEGQRLAEMRKRIVAAEDRFYALYNELNKNDDFDVHCVNEAPLGTRLKKRKCQPEFYSQAETDYALSFWLMLRGDAGGGAARSPTLVALEREPEYQAAMLKIVKDNPALLQLLRERSRLEDRYNAARKQRFKKP
jgi:hypothetical protein